MPATGLENIVDSIRRESEEKIKDLWAEFESKKNSLIEETVRYVKQFEEKNVHDVLEKMKIQEEKTESLAAMKYRNGVLKAKLDIANKVLESAKEYILNLPDDQYFELVLRICRPHFSKARSARLVFSREDFNRLSSATKRKFLDQAKESGMDLRIVKSESEYRFGGAKLDFFDIEENCTLDAVFDEHRDVILSFFMDFLFTERQVLPEPEEEFPYVEAPEDFADKDFDVASSNSEHENLDSSYRERRISVPESTVTAKENLFVGSLPSEKKLEKDVVSSGFTVDDFATKNGEIISTCESSSQENGKTFQNDGNSVGDSGKGESKKNKLGVFDGQMSSADFKPTDASKSSLKSVGSSEKKVFSKNSDVNSSFPENEIIPGFVREPKSKNKTSGHTDRPVRNSQSKSSKVSNSGVVKSLDSSDFVAASEGQASLESSDNLRRRASSKKSSVGGLSFSENEVIPGFVRKPKARNKISDRSDRSVKVSKSKDQKKLKVGSIKKVNSEGFEFAGGETQDILPRGLNPKQSESLGRGKVSRGKKVSEKESEKTTRSAVRYKTNATPGKQTDKVRKLKKSDDSEEN